MATLCHMGIIKISIRYILLVFGLTSIMASNIELEIKDQGLIVHNHRIKETID